MLEDEFSELRNVSIFKEMRSENFRELLQNASIQTFPPFSELIREGKPSHFLHVVLSGMVSLHSTWNTRETTMMIVRPGSTFIAAATLKEAPYLMSGETLKKSRIALIPSQNVRSLFEKDAQFARAVVVELAENFRLLVKTTKNLKLRVSRERLANYLLREQQRAGNVGRFTLGLKKKRLASLLGMQPESLSPRIQNVEKPRRDKRRCHRNYF